MRINQEIRNLIAGVSQQPPMSRHPEQLEEQINGLSNEVSGLQKRPPSVLVDRHTTSERIDPNALLHWVERDGVIYMIEIRANGTVRVLEPSKGWRSVSVEDNAAKYLACENPKTDLKIITVADCSFIVNTKKVTRMSNNKGTDPWATQGLLVNIKQGGFNRNYQVTINGVLTAFYSTPDGQEASHASQIIPSSIAQNLGRGNCVQQSSWIYYYGRNVNSYKVSDGFNNSGISAVHKEVARAEDLPSSAPEGFTVKVVGEKATEDNYYLVYKDNLWRETVCPNLYNEIDKNSMPVGLHLQEDGSFKLKAFEWNDRETGDEDSNPTPSFIGQCITDIFFFRNRLGLISGENVNLSASGDFFNYWVNGATDILDTDPIDVAVSHNRLCNLIHAVPFNRDLYLFSDSTQFVITGDGILTPKNTTVDQVTEFKSSPYVRPIGVGRNLYYISERLGFSSVNEYSATVNEAFARDSQDISAHVPNYIPNTVFSIMANPNENIMLFLTTENKKTIFVYKYLYLGDQKVQSAWSKWEFKGNIIGGDFIKNCIYLAIDYGNSTTIEKIDITYNTKDFQGEPYRVMLDRKQPITIDRTEETAREDNKMEVVVENLKGDNLPYQFVSNNGSVFTADERGVLILPYEPHVEGYVGVPYVFKAELTTLYVKQTNQGSTSRIPTYRLNVDRLQVNYTNTGQIDVEVSDKNNSRATGRTVGIKTNIVNNHPLTTGILNVPIYKENTGAKIEIINNTPLPSSLTSVTWSGNMITRGRSV